MAAASAVDDSHSKRHELGRKLKLPFRELKEKLHHNHHLSDAKVHLIHQKYLGPNIHILTNKCSPLAGTKSASSQTW